MGRLKVPKIKIDKADRNFSWWVRLRDGKCLRCGSPVRFNDKQLPVSHHASHFQGRGRENTRFNEFNLVCLCHGCHSFFHAQPSECVKWQTERLGKKMVEELEITSRYYCKRDRKSQELYWKQKLLEDFGVVV